MKKIKPVKLRTPIITFERIRISLGIVCYAIAAEYVDPRPFMPTPLARFLYAALLLEITRQVLTARMETSWAAAVSARSWKDRWERLRRRLPEYARYRVRRFLTIMAGLWSAGFMIDALTQRCEGAFQCILLAPRLAVENLPTALQVALYIAIGMMQLIIMMWSLTKVGFVKVIMPGTIDVSWDDVYGQDAARDKVRQQVELLESSTAVEEAGGYMPKGILLYGPPGTGKTLLAKAAAAASTKPLILVPPGGFASTFVGVNFLKVSSLFRLIRKMGHRYGGVIVFIDEIDSLGTRGHAAEITMHSSYELGMTGCAVSTAVDLVRNEVTYVDGGGGNQGTLQSFLAALEGMDEPRGLVNKILALLGFKPLPPIVSKWLIMGATNRKEAIDPALLRAGRLGRHINVPLPGFTGKHATYKGYLAKVRHTLTDAQVEWAARLHANGTGAEIKDIVNEAVLLTFADDREEPGVVRYDDMVRAMTRVKFGEPERPFDTPAAARMVAIHEAGHAVLVHYLLRHRLRIWFATIERFGKSGGMVVFSPVSEDWVESKTDVEAGAAISLASRVVETLFFGEPTNGHGGDGRAATMTAERMVKYGHTYDPVTGSGRIGTLSGDDKGYEALVESVLAKAYKRANDVLSPRKGQIDALAKMMVERGTVPGDEVHALLEEMEESRR